MRKKNQQLIKDLKELEKLKLRRNKSFNKKRTSAVNYGNDTKGSMGLEAALSL